MNQSSLMVFKGFFDRYPREMQETFLPLLSQEQKTLLQTLPPLIPFARDKLFFDLLDWTHPSWLAPYLRTLSKTDIASCLSALKQEQSKYLQQALGQTNNLPSPNQSAKGALRDFLRQLLTENKEVLPFAFLPNHPLNFLLDVPQAKLTTLVRFLGLHDLAVEMRQIIDASLLKTVFSHLTKQQSTYLNQLMLHREPLIFKRLFLQTWDKTKEMLAKQLDERGVHRLYHALHRTQPPLTWYLSRRLPLHLGSQLFKYEDKPTHERAEAILTEQIHKILTFLEKQERET